MISVKTYLPLLNNKKKFLFVILTFLTLLVCFEENSYASKIYSLVRVNKNIITNIDLLLEIKMLKLQFKINQNENILKKIALNNLIEYRIKEEEIKKNKIDFYKNDDLIKKQINNILLEILKNNNLDENQKKEIEKQLLYRLRINYSWSFLIRSKYLNNINLNLNELNEISNNTKIDKKAKDNLIKNEQIKKLNKYSLTYYNEVKKNYIIFFYDK